MDSKTRFYQFINMFHSAIHFIFVKIQWHFPFVTVLLLKFTISKQILFTLVDNSFKVSFKPLSLAFSLPFSTLIYNVTKLLFREMRVIAILLYLLLI